MDDLLDMIIDDESPSSISDKIKDLLFAKSSEKVDASRPNSAQNAFGFDSEEQVSDEESE